ncbi:MAG: helix-turn-helix transcriptional regulator [Clostridia bacterium]|nr:helix-turn-helix transcriptional regulator [Clostridia bacterium]
MDINKKIVNLCNERGWSIYELSLQSGITQSSLNSMLHRGNPPKIENLQCICEAFGITLSQFFLEDEQLEILSQREKELVSLFRRLPENKQQALIDLINR